MKFVIASSTSEVAYQSNAFWQQFDEIEVENPNGWYIRYVVGGFVHSFGYSQSSGRGEYFSEYKEDVYTHPLPFSDDPKANAEIMRNAKYDNMKAVLIREPQ